jgi:superfamily II DNA or RNA helicase
MWCYVKKDNFENFIQEKHLQEFADNIKLFETSDAIFLPRLFIENYSSKYLIEYSGKKQNSPQKTDFKFIKNLREEQQPIVETILDIYQKQGYVNGVVKARPGLGKTVLSLYIASKIGLKTCVIVDNTEIMNQWIRSTYDFLDLKEEDIGIIKQKLLSVDKPIVIAMSQTLCSKIKGNISKSFELIEDGKFGLVIYDEVHTTSSTERYAQTSLLFRTRNIIGLSATPFRTGAAEILMKNTIGNIIYETNKYDLKPQYNFYFYDSGLSDKYNMAFRRVTDYMQKKAIYNSFISNSQIYLSIIVSKTQQLQSDGHVVSILCMTHKQIQNISDELTKNGISHRRYYGAEKEIDKENDDVIVMTYQFAGKGFDFKRLSAMILACPLAGKVSLIQSVGRILRSNQDKKQPVVFDLIDTGFPSMFIPEVKTKERIITNEFECDIKFINH